MLCRRWATRLASASLLLASVAGCAGLGTPESQLFGKDSRYRSASITYRVAMKPSQPAAKSGSRVKFLQPSVHAQPTDSRTMTLAVRYPHPAGRAGYARVECVVERASAGGQAEGTVAAWFDRTRRLIDETMPGVKFGEGVQDAMGLDVPVGELERVLARLEQPAAQDSAGPNRVAVRLTGEVNGVAVPRRTSRVSELDQLAARVRRDGSIISHAMPLDDAIDAGAAESIVERHQDTTTPPVALQPPPAQPADEPAADSSVVPASFVAPAMWRLPPVDQVVR